MPAIPSLSMDQQHHHGAQSHSHQQPPQLQDLMQQLQQLPAQATAQQLHALVRSLMDSLLLRKQAKDTLGTTASSAEESAAAAGASDEEDDSEAEVHEQNFEQFFDFLFEICFESQLDARSLCNVIYCIYMLLLNHEVLMEQFIKYSSINFLLDLYRSRLQLATGATAAAGVAPSKVPAMLAAHTAAGQNSSLSQLKDIAGLPLGSKTHSFIKFLQHHRTQSQDEAGSPVGNDTRVTPVQQFSQDSQGVVIPKLDMSQQQSNSSSSSLLGSSRASGAFSRLSRRLDSNGSDSSMDSIRMNLGTNLGRRNSMRMSMKDMRSSQNSTGSGSSSPRISAIDYMTSLAAKIGELYISYDLTYLLSIKRDLDLRSGRQDSPADEPSESAQPSSAASSDSSSQQGASPLNNEYMYGYQEGDLITSPDGLIISRSVSQVLFYQRTASASTQIGSSILRLLILKTLQHLSNHSFARKLSRNPTTTLAQELSAIVDRYQSPQQLLSRDPADPHRLIDRECVSTIYSILGNYGEEVEAKFVQKWHEMEQTKQPKGTVQGRKYDLFLWRWAATTTQVVQQRDWIRIGNQLHSLSCYIEASASRVHARQCTAVCIDLLLRIMTLMKAGTMSPSGSFRTGCQITDAVHHLLRIFTILINSTDRNPLMLEFFYFLLVDNEENFKWMREYSCFAFADVGSMGTPRRSAPNSAFIGSPGPSTTADSLDMSVSLTARRCGVIRHFESLMYLFHELGEEFLDERQKTRQSVDSSQLQEELLQQSDRAANAMRKFDFLINPVDGIVLHYLTSAESRDAEGSVLGTDISVTVEMLKFLEQAFKLPHLPFLYIESYVNSYIRFHFLNFVKLYISPSSAPLTLQLCKLHLNVLLAFSTNKTHQIVKRFSAMKVVKFLAREIDLEHQFSEMLKKKQRPHSHHQQRPQSAQSSSAAQAAAYEGSDGSDSDDESENSSDASFVYDDDKPPEVEGVLPKLNVGGLPFGNGALGIYGQEAPVDGIAQDDGDDSTEDDADSDEDDSDEDGDEEEERAAPRPMLPQLSVAGLGITGMDPGPRESDILAAQAASLKGPSIPGLEKNHSFQKRRKSTVDENETDDATSEYDDDDDVDLISLASSSAPPKLGVPLGVEPLHDAFSAAFKPKPARTQSLLEQSLGLGSRRNSNADFDDTGSRRTSNADMFDEDEDDMSEASVASDMRPQLPLGMAEKLMLPTLLPMKPKASSPIAALSLNSMQQQLHTATQQASTQQTEADSFRSTDTDELVDQDEQLNSTLFGKASPPTAFADRQNKGSMFKDDEDLYEAERRSRKLYADPELHTSVVALLISLLLTSSQTLDPQYTDRMPINRNLPNIPFLLHHHVNSYYNEYLVPLLHKRIQTMGLGATIFLRLLCKKLFTSHLYSKRQERIGKGAYGIVWRATLPFSHSPSIRSVAVKLLQVPKTMHDLCVVTDIFNEIIIMERFKGDSRVCRLYDYGLDDEYYYIVMKEYRCTLKTWREKQSTPLQSNMPLYMNVFKKVLECFRFLRDNRVNHFDIKCENVFIEPFEDVPERELWDSRTEIPPFEVVVGDFGESHIFSSEKDAYTVRHRGTNCIKSPEMLKIEMMKSNSKFYDRRRKVGASSASDVWSLGCLFFELMSGEFLFEANEDTFTQFYVQLTDENKTLIPQERFSKMNYNPVLMDVLAYMLVRDPVRRPTIHDVLVKFGDWLKFFPPLQTLKQRFGGAAAALYSARDLKQHAADNAQHEHDYMYYDLATPKSNPSSPQNAQKGVLSASTPDSSSTDGLPTSNNPGISKLFSPSKSKLLGSQEGSGLMKQALLQGRSSPASPQTPSSRTPIRPSAPVQGRNYAWNANDIAFFNQHATVLINNRLILGSDRVADDKRLLVELGITHIVNCSGNMQPLPRFPDNYHYFNVRSRLTDPDCYAEYLNGFIFVRDAIKRRGRVLIYSGKGLSRSALFAVLYLMHCYNLSSFEAYLYVREKRPALRPEILSHFLHFLLSVQRPKLPSHVFGQQMYFDVQKKLVIPSSSSSFRNNSSANGSMDHPQHHHQRQSSAPRLANNGDIVGTGIRKLQQLGPNDVVHWFKCICGSCVVGIVSPFNIYEFDGDALEDIPDSPMRSWPTFLDEMRQLYFYTGAPDGRTSGCVSFALLDMSQQKTQQQVLFEPFQLDDHTEVFEPLVSPHGSSLVQPQSSWTIHCCKHCGYMVYCSRTKAPGTSTAGVASSSSNAEEEMPVEQVLAQSDMAINTSLKTEEVAYTNKVQDLRSILFFRAATGTTFSMF